MNIVTAEKLPRTTVERIESSSALLCCPT